MKWEELFIGLTKNIINSKINLNLKGDQYVQKNRYYPIAVGNGSDYRLHQE